MFWAWKMKGFLVQVKDLFREQLKIVIGFQQESDIIRFGFLRALWVLCKEWLELDKSGCVEIN